MSCKTCAAARRAMLARLARLRQRRPVKVHCDDPPFPVPRHPPERRN